MRKERIFSLARKIFLWTITGSRYEYRGGEEGRVLRIFGVIELSANYENENDTSSRGGRRHGFEPPHVSVEFGYLSRGGHGIYSWLSRKPAAERVFPPASIAGKSRK